MNNLKALRLSLRMSREEFAKRIGIYPDYIVDLETSDRQLTAAWPEAIEKAFDITTEEFSDPVYGGVANADMLLPAKRQFACPISIRFALQILIAKIAGVHRSQNISEDQYADAVISLNAYIADSAGDPGDDEDRFNRLLKGLQITVLTIAQSCEIDLPNDPEKYLDAVLPPLARLIESYARSPS